MICRRWTGEEPEALISLWVRVFGDDPAEITEFLSASGAETLCGYEGEQLVSMLHLLPVTVSGASRQGYYLYAAATDPDFRKGGRMTELLSFAAEYTRSMGRDSIFLLSANEGLRDYYAARGYVTVSGVEEVVFPAVQGEQRLTPCTAAEFLALRQAYLASFPAAFCPEEPFAAFLWRYIRNQEGEVLLLPQKSTDGALQSYAICYTINGELWVEETSLPPEEYPSGAALLSAHYGGLPVRMRTPGKRPFGMALSCDRRPLPPVYMNGMME